MGHILDILVGPSLSDTPTDRPASCGYNEDILIYASPRWLREWTLSIKVSPSLPVTTSDSTRIQLSDPRDLRNLTYW